MRLVKEIIKEIYLDFRGKNWLKKSYSQCGEDIIVEIIFDCGMVKMIQLEYGGCNIDSRVLLRDFFDLFSRHNYALYKILPKDIKRFERYDQRLENFQHQNCVVVSNGIEIGK